MRKLAAGILFTLLVFSLAACKNASISNGETSSHLKATIPSSQFESRDEVFALLNGVWVDTDNNSTYYIFQNEKLLWVTKSGFLDAVHNVFDATLEKNGVSGLMQLDLQNVANSISATDTPGIASYIVSVDPEAGTIIADEGNFNERHIVIDEESVRINESGSEIFHSLQKVSDQAELTGECFEELFSEGKDNYAIPTAYFWTDTEEYGAWVRTCFGDAQFNAWFEQVNTEDPIIYKTPNWNTSINGAYVVTEDSLTFSYKVNFTMVYGQEAYPTLTVTFGRESGTVRVLDVYNNSLSLPSLVIYGLGAVKNFPGAYTDYMELAYALDAEPADISYGTETRTHYHNGLTYTLKYRTDGVLGEFSIKADETISLGDVIRWQKQETGTETSQTGQNGNTQSSNKETNMPIPMNDVPYTTSLSGSVEIYSEPGCNSAFVQTIGEDGVFTIVAESYDNAGNLWGKLKSGLGWVLLTENTNPTTAQSAQSRELTQLFDSSKLWVAKWYFEGYDYDFHFIFEENGSFYFTLSYYEIYSGGTGSYSVGDGNTLFVDIQLDGEPASATYAFDPSTFSLTVISNTGLIAEKNDVLILQEDTDGDIENLKYWAKQFAEGLYEGNP